MIREFKEFLLKQNAIALAIGVIIGAAVSKVVSSIVDNILNPIVSLLLPAGDWRRNHPRFQGENFEKNLELVRRVESLARAKGCLPSQLALAWVLAQGDDMVPIPGTTRRKHLEENVGALAVSLSAADLSSIDEAAPKGVAAGERYTAEGMRAVNL